MVDAVDCFGRAAELNCCGCPILLSGSAKTLGAVADLAAIQSVQRRVIGDEGRRENTKDLTCERTYSDCT